MKAAHKGQVAVEFLMYAGLFMIIAIAAFVLTTFAERGDVGIRESQLLDAFTYRFASAPIITYKGGEGLIYDISFPRQLDNRNYTITYIRMDDGSCSIQVFWDGSFQNYTYSYVIAPAHYLRGDPDLGDVSCLETIPNAEMKAEVDHAVRLTPDKSSGHLVFRNIGLEAGASTYPTIELYCSLEEEGP